MKRSLDKYLSQKIPRFPAKATSFPEMRAGRRKRLELFFELIDASVFSRLRPNETPDPELRESSIPYLSGSANEIFVAGQFTQAAGTAGMILVRGNPDFRAETELAAIVESRAGIDHYGGRIDSACKLFGSRRVVRNDRVGMR
jgi:hypothetical protein